MTTTRRASVARRGEKVKRPLMRYHGGKWVLAPWIISYFPTHRVYVEPYGGAASVLLRKPRCYGEVYNDLDDEVWNVFRVLQNPETKEVLKAKLESTPFARREFEQAYQPTEDPIERARRTIIRSFMGFSSNATHKASGFRADSNHSGTIPAHDWANLTTGFRANNWGDGKSGGHVPACTQLARFPSHIEAFHERLCGVVLENRPALDVIRQHDSEQTLFYVDPPYPKDTRTDAGDDYAIELTDENHRELAAALQAVKGMVILSGYNCPLYDELYAGWVRIDHASHADGARKRTESLWINAACKPPQGRLL